ncbi:hypothetical protein ScPMuIL_008857 [Solemya velum]
MESPDIDSRHAMGIPMNNSVYKTQEYWDERYKSEKSFEWFAGYSSFKTFIKADVQPSDKILVLGCGNSQMSYDMYQDGYQNIVNVDYSPVVIETMREEYEEQDPWSLSETAENQIEQILYKVSSLLKNNGKFISVTFCQPHFRRPVYAKSAFQWRVCQQQFGETFHYFYYTATKGKLLCEKDCQAEIKRRKNRTAPSEKSVIFLENSDTKDFLLHLCALNF